MKQVHRFIKTNNITLHVVEAGPADGQLVILLHGFPDFWYGWKHQIEPLAEAGYRVVVPDQRGYNLSAKPRGVKAYNMDVLAQDVIGLIKHYNASKAVVVGHDWGGVISWWLGHKYPEYVEKICILNVPHPWAMKQQLKSNRAQQKKSWYFLAFQIPWFPEASVYLDRGRFLGEKIKCSARMGIFDEKELTLYKKAWLQPRAMTSMINWYRASLQHPPEKPTHHKISVPSLLIWGCMDKFLGRELAQPSLDFCENGQLEFIEEATHWVQHEEPERVNQLLLSFIQKK